MEKFPISDYLRDYEQASRRGTCKACLKSVKWSRDSVGAHKRATCENTSAEEKEKFAKISNVSSLNDSSDELPVQIQLNNHLKDSCFISEIGNFQISSYLRDYNLATRRGTCKACLKSVKWSRSSVGSHKRASSAQGKRENLLKYRMPLVSTNQSAHRSKFTQEE